MYSISAISFICIDTAYLFEVIDRTYGFEKELWYYITYGIIEWIARITYWLALWEFSFKNWVVSKEMPNMLARQCSLIEDEQILKTPTFFCCIKVGERGYKIIDRAFTANIILSAALFGTVC